VYIERLGHHDIDRLFEDAGEQGLLKLHVHLYEDMVHNKLAACSQDMHRRVVQIFSILDLAECRPASLASPKVKQFLGNVLKTDQDNYPEILYKMYIVNAPWIFRAVWGAIKGFLDANTIAKIHILGDSSSYLDPLQEDIELEHLPDFLGGRQPSLDWPGHQPGPWMDWQHSRPFPEVHKAIHTAADPPVRAIEFQKGVPAWSCLRTIGSGPARLVHRRRTPCAVLAAGAATQQQPSCRIEVVALEDLAVMYDAETRYHAVDAC